VKPARLLVLAALLLTSSAQALTLEDAIAAAIAHAPAMAEAEAMRDAADGRLSQARGARLPTLSIQGSAGVGRLDAQGYFGLGNAAQTPLSAQATIEQPLYSGGRIAAANARARAGLEASQASAAMAEANLAADVAAAYGAVLASKTMVQAYTRALDQMTEIDRQAGLRFNAGEAPSTDVAQAAARLAEARGGLAGARGEAATAGARFRALTGLEAQDLAPISQGPDAPASLDEALERARANSPVIAAAKAAFDAANAATRGARAERLPSIGAFAEAGLMRDQFFPDYRMNSATVGVRARWTLFAGQTSGKVAEMSAEARAAEARLRAATAYRLQALLGPA
jgi:outer membrane protein